MESNELKKSFEKMVVDLNDAIVFEFLDNLRESGVTNMFGASPYLQQEFGCDVKTAHYYLKRWMDTYRAWHPTH